MAPLWSIRNLPMAIPKSGSTTTGTPRPLLVVPLDGYSTFTKFLRGSAFAPLLNLSRCLAVVLRHIVGKDGRMLRCIEDYTGSFISVTDCDEQQGTMRAWGGQGSLARVLILAILFGFTSALDTISRNGIMSIRDVNRPFVG